MPASEYINGYIEQAEIEQKKAKEPWLKNFFRVFSSELKERSSKASPGDKYVVTSPFATALNELIPDGLKITIEVGLKYYIDLPNKKALSDLLSGKKIDFAVDGKTATLLIELWAVKKFASSKPGKVVKTASLHLFPYRTNVDGLRLLNEALGKPLDYFWVLCTPGLTFDVAAIRSFREEVSKIVG